MPDKREIWQSAQDIIDRYGSDALRQINIRIGELQRHGEQEARSTWLQIREAAETLLEARDRKTKH